MKKNNQKNHIFCALIGLASLVIILIIWLVSGIQSETYTSEIIPYNETIESDFSDFESLSADVYSQLEKHCEDTYLTRIIADTRDNIEKDPWSNIDLVFFRYIDDSREGGNVYQLTVSIDCISQKITKLSIFNGSGRALGPSNTDKISQEILRTYKAENKNKLKPAKRYIFNGAGIQEYEIVK